MESHVAPAWSNGFNFQNISIKAGTFDLHLVGFQLTALKNFKNTLRGAKQQWLYGVQWSLLSSFTKPSFINLNSVSSLLAKIVFILTKVRENSHIYIYAHNPFQKRLRQEDGGFQTNTDIRSLISLMLASEYSCPYPHAILPCMTVSFCPCALLMNILFLLFNNI